MARPLPRWVKVVCWAAPVAVSLGPVALIATSPYLPARAPVYIIAGVAGAVAMALMLLQPLLAGGYMPGLPRHRAQYWHRWVGAALLIAVALHIAGLYLTSPPDAMDALLLVSPTPFSIYGVMAMWALIATALLVAFRGTLRRTAGLRPRHWKILHNALALIAVIGSVVHAMLIEGTMEPLSKAALCGAILVVTISAIVHLRLIKSHRG